MILRRGSLCWRFCDVDISWWKRIYFSGICLSQYILKNSWRHIAKTNLYINFYLCSTYWRNLAHLNLVVIRLKQWVLKNYEKHDVKTKTPREVFAGSKVNFEWWQMKVISKTRSDAGYRTKIPTGYRSIVLR